MLNVKSKTEDYSSGLTVFILKNMIYCILYIIIALFAGIFIMYTSKDSDLFPLIILGVIWPVTVCMCIIYLIIRYSFKLIESLFDKTFIKKYKHAW